MCTASTTELRVRVETITQIARRRVTHLACTLVA
jgi:hypothetical protein